MASVQLVNASWLLVINQAVQGFILKPTLIFYNES